jgi:hypothetical protein
MIELTKKQQRDLSQSAESPPRVLDPATQTEYVLIRADLYERICTMVGNDDLDAPDVNFLVERAMKDEDASDPTLDFYQQKYAPSL